MAQEVRVGQSLLRFEPPDTLFEVIVGDLSGAEAQAILEEADKLMQGAADIYLLADVSRIGAILPESRRAVRNARPWPNLRGTALVGASYHVRVMATLILKAAAIFWRSANEVGFFETEGQARAWIAELRRKRSRGGD